VARIAAVRAVVAKEEVLLKTQLESWIVGVVTLHDVRLGKPFVIDIYKAIPDFESISGDTDYALYNRLLTPGTGDFARCYDYVTAPNSSSKGERIIRRSLIEEEQKILRILEVDLQVPQLVDDHTFLIIEGGVHTDPVHREGLYNQ